MMQIHRLVPHALALTTALSWQQVSAAGSSSSSSNVIIYVIIGVVVVLFVGIAVFVWRRNHRRGTELPETLPGIPQQQANQRHMSPVNPSIGGASMQSSFKNKAYHSVETPAVSHPSWDINQRPNQSMPPPSDPWRAPSRTPPPPVPPVRVNRPPPVSAPGGKNASRKSEQAREVASRIMTEFRTHPTLGRRVLPYSALYFTRVLNKGAFGEVWLAQWENRQVAVKRILNEKKYDEKEIQCFAAEIKLMASFSHPKIVEFIGVAWSDTSDMCAVTEYMAKSDLYSFLKRKGAQLNWRDHKIYLAEDAADAMSYLHSLSPKVIHRDLKSKNILLDDSFRAKLSDFGISRERSLQETMTAGVGTIYWTAPEVLLGKKYTEKADIYSFGIVMSELDTHEVPYSDMRDEGGKKLHGMKVVQMVIRKNLRPTFSPNCPRPVRELALRCLDSDPDARPDAFELLSRIQSVQDELTDE